MTKEELEYLSDIADRYDFANHDYYGHADVEMDKDDAEVIRKAVKALEQEPKFIAKADGAIEPIKNCDDCTFRKEWEKIGKLVSVVLEKQTEQEPKVGHWIRFKNFENGYYHIKCSECGQYWSVDGHAKIFRYCFNCGCKMSEVDE